MSGAPSAGELAARLTRGQTRAKSLAEEALARIEATNDLWHVFITATPERALRAAEASDRRRAAGRTLGDLDGIPFAVKDNLDAAGVPTSDGARMPDRAAAADAVAVARLEAAGAVLLGKLNMHEGALGATTDNAVWGRCENPAMPGFTPGGSSGGSAAAIAGGIAPVTLGTDTMGSVRIPAAYGGLWGLKPTFGLVPRRGLSLLSPSLDAIGPLARSADDLALVLGAVAGFDGDDPDSVAPPPGWSAAAQEAPLRDVVLGVPTALAAVPREDAVRKSFALLVEAARHAGASVREVEVAGWEPAAARRAGLLVLEAEASVRLGPLFDRGESPYGEAFQAMITFGRRAPGEKLAAAFRRLSLLRSATLRALGEVDALLMPTAPQQPFPHGTPAPVSQADLTALANLAGCPAVAFPHAFGGARPKGSAQLVGKPFAEGRLLGLAKRLEALS